MYSQSLPFSKSLVDEILGYAISRGLRLPMSHGRDLVARILVGKPYAQAMAAKSVGKLGPVTVDEQRNARLRAEFLPDATAIDSLESIVHHFLFWAEDRLTLVMSLTKAIRLGRIPPPPEVTWDVLDGWLARHQLTRADLEVVSAGPTVVHRGRHLSFVRRGEWWYLLEDFLLEDVSKRPIGQLSVVVGGMMCFGRSCLPDHSALGWIFENGCWDLRWNVHRIADETDLDLTFEQLANGG